MPGLQGGGRTLRPRNPMPQDIAAPIEARGLRDAYNKRPPYQRNDYLGWIGRARREEARERRIAEMLEELAGGELYMHMAWRTGRTSTRG